MQNVFVVHIRCLTFNEVRDLMIYEIMILNSEVWDFYSLYKCFLELMSVLNFG